jgi:polyribonucleotide nucleotidyltransferase
MELAGRMLTIEIGKLAKQANGSAVVRYGDTVVLVTATASKDPREGVDFFPLTVDYEEKLYAVGKIPGGFIRREGRATENATLSARMIDRPIRPMFPKAFKNDVQVVATIMSVDQNNSPNVLGIIGASVALNISNIPFAEPLAAVNVGMIDGKLIINPTIAQMDTTQMFITVAGTAEAIMMVEGHADEVPEEQVLEAIFFAHEQIKEIVAFQNTFIAQHATPKVAVVETPVDEALVAEVTNYAEALLTAAVKNPDKKLREDHMEKARTEILDKYAETYPEKGKLISQLLDKLLKSVVRKMVTEDRQRVDGRELNEIRPVSCEVGYLPRAHGSGLFTRGQTQVMSVATLGGVREEQMLDGLGIEDSKRYIHHYNFPGYSVGEARPMRGPGRREIGHGALAERALLAVLPPLEEFPYTIRVVSEVLESNGSSSMGSVCGSTLALMHAGVPITAPVSGIAMGLVKEGDKFAILSDIQGIEDALGDMDFKLAGTEKGVTALQMDIKISGVSREIVREALQQAHEGRAFILGKMLEAIAVPNRELSPFAPQMIQIKIPVDKIREVIGSGGKIIQKIVAETGCKIDIQDDGNIFIMAVDREEGRRAQEIISAIISEVEVGKIYDGVVKRIMDFGAFVEVIPGVFGSSGKEGMVHISQLALQRVEKVTDVVKVGDPLQVKCVEIDDRGRVNLSHKAVLQGQNKR